MSEASRRGLAAIPGSSCPAWDFRFRWSTSSVCVLKQIEMTETALRDNAKIVITEHGISPTLLLGSLPVTLDQQHKTP